MLRLCSDCIESLCPAFGELHGHWEQEGGRQECVREDQVRGSYGDWLACGFRPSRVQAWERAREGRVTSSRVGGCGRTRRVSEATAKGQREDEGEEVRYAAPSSFSP